MYLLFLKSLKSLFLKPIKATEKGKRLKLPRFTRNLRYDVCGLYSYETLISKIDMKHKTVKRLGWWSKTSSRHHNWVCKYLKEQFDFTEIKVKVKIFRVCGVCAVEIEGGRHCFVCLMRDAISGNNYLT